MFKKKLFRVSIKSAILGFKVKIANVFSEINGFAVQIQKKMPILNAKSISKKISIFL